MADRGEYRPIYSVLPDSPEFQVLEKDARLLLYTIKLTLGPSGIGILYDEQLKDRSGLTTAELETAKAELIEAEWLQVEGRVYWLRNGLKYEPTFTMENGNHRKNVLKHIKGLPRQPIVNRFSRYYDLPLPFPDVENSGDRKGLRRGSEGVSDALGNHTPPLRHPLNTPTPGGGDYEGNSDQRARETPSAPSEPATDSKLEELISWVGDKWRDDVEAVAELADDPEIWARALLGLYGPSGTEERMLKDVPSEEHPSVLATALLRYSVDGGDQWDSKFFRGFVRKAVGERIRDRQPPPGPDFGDETRRDEDRREAHRQRESEASVDRAAEEIERQGSELRELRQWYEDLDDETREKVDEDAEKRVEIMASATHGRVPKAMKEAAQIEAMKSAKRADHSLTTG